MSDAITLIVSEETGNISLSHLGNLKNDLTIDELVAYLEQELIVDEDEATGVTDRLYQWVMKGVRGE